MKTTLGMQRGGPGRRLFVTLVFATIGGAIASALQLPVAWLLGAVVAVSAVSLAGLNTDLPQSLKTLAFFILGVQAGSGVTPAVFDQIAVWPASFAIQMAGVVAIVVGTRAVLMRVFGWDSDTALFASLPGALSFVMAATEDTRADQRRVAVVQSMRLVFVIGALVPILATVQAGDPEFGARGAGTMGEYALLFAVAAGAAAVGHFLRVPAGLLLGALIASAALHLTGATSAAVPPILSIPALILMGTLIGSRLAGISFSAFLDLLPAAIVAFVFALALASGAGLVAVAFLDLPFEKVALAYAPGALEALTALAFQFDVDPAYVAAHHVVRFMALAIVIPLLVRRATRGERGEEVKTEG